MPERVGRGVSLQFTLGSYLAQVAEVEAPKDGVVRVRRVVCAVDCGTVVNPIRRRAQIQSGIIFGVTAALATGSEPKCCPDTYLGTNGPSSDAPRR